MKKTFLQPKNILTFSISDYVNYITDELLYKNIKNIQTSFIFVEPSELISRDGSEININLHETELRTKNINSIKLQFMSKQNNEKYILTQENIKYNIMCGYNLIFDEDFQQNTNLLTTGLILPTKYIEEDHSIYINIKNISNIVFDDLILQILYDEVEFEEEFERFIPSSQIDQLIKYNNNTYNVFRVVFGMGVKAIVEDLPKDEFNNTTSKIACKIIV
jgi:hypothetical protein